MKLKTLLNELKYNLKYDLTSEAGWAELINKMIVNIYEKDLLEATVKKEFIEWSEDEILGLRDQGWEDELEPARYLNEIWDTRMKKLTNRYERMRGDTAKQIRLLKQREAKQAHYDLMVEKYIGDGLDKYLEREGINLHTTKIQLVAPTGAGKSTSLAGLKGIDQLVIFKGERALIDNNYKSLLKDMDKKVIAEKTVYIVRGGVNENKAEKVVKTGKLVEVSIWEMVRDKKAIILCIFDKATLLHHEIVRAERIVREPNKWLYIMDESHKLVTNRYRQETMAKLWWVFEQRKGYIATTATPIIYCPLNVDKEIYIGSKQKLKVKVKVFTHKKSQIEKLFRDHVMAKSVGKKELIIFYQNNTYMLKSIAKMQGLDADVVVMNKDVYNRMNGNQEHLAYGIKGGKLNDKVKVIMTTSLLLEGFSFEPDSEAYDKVTYYLSGDNYSYMGSSLELIQAGARVRKANEVEIIIGRPEKPMDKRYDRMMEGFMAGRFDVKDMKIDMAKATYYLALDKERVEIEEMEKVAEIEEYMKLWEKLLPRDQVVIDNYRWEGERRLKVKEIITHSLETTTLNYEKDKRAEQRDQELFESRLRRAGIEDIEYFSEEVRLTDEENNLLNDTAKLEAEKDKLKYVGYFEGLGEAGMSKMLGKLKTKALSQAEVKMIDFLVIYGRFRGLGFTFQDTITRMRAETESQLSKFVKRAYDGTYLKLRYLDKVEWSKDEIELLEAGVLRDHKAADKKGFNLFGELVKLVDLMKEFQVIDGRLLKGIDKPKNLLERVFIVEETRKKTPMIEGKRVDYFEYELKGLKPEVKYLFEQSGGSPVKTKEAIMKRFRVELELKGIKEEAKQGLEAQADTGQDPARTSPVVDWDMEIEEEEEFIDDSFFQKMIVR